MAPKMYCLPCMYSDHKKCPKKRLGKVCACNHDQKSDDEITRYLDSLNLTRLDIEVVHEEAKGNTPRPTRQTSPPRRPARGKKKKRDFKKLTAYVQKADTED